MEILPAGSYILYFAGFNLWFRLVLILQLTCEKEHGVLRGQRVRGNNNRTKGLMFELELVSSDPQTPNQTDW